MPGGTHEPVSITPGDFRVCGGLWWDPPAGALPGGWEGRPAAAGPRWGQDEEPPAPGDPLGADLPHPPTALHRKPYKEITRHLPKMSFSAGASTQEEDI